MPTWLSPTGCLACRYASKGLKRLLRDDECFCDVGLPSASDATVELCFTLDRCVWPSTRDKEHTQTTIFPGTTNHARQTAPEAATAASSIPQHRRSYTCVVWYSRLPTDSTTTNKHNHHSWKSNYHSNYHSHNPSHSPSHTPSHKTLAQPLAQTLAQTLAQQGRKGPAQQQQQQQQTFAAGGVGPGYGGEPRSRWPTACLDLPHKHAGQVK